MGVEVLALIKSSPRAGNRVAQEAGNGPVLGLPSSDVYDTARSAQ